MVPPNGPLRRASFERGGAFSVLERSGDSFRRCGGLGHDDAATHAQIELARVCVYSAALSDRIGRKRGDPEAPVSGLTRGASHARHASRCRGQSPRWHARQQYRARMHRAHRFVASCCVHPAQR